MEEGAERKRGGRGGKGKGGQGTLTRPASNWTGRILMVMGGSSTPVAAPEAQSPLFEL